ncbi:MAG: rhomboid family intramembrane serine protease [Desulfuromonas sp.]|nr:MAG: rhomboid family intramembrane serine protease [Desulfuromonas sp.]
MNGTRWQWKMMKYERTFKGLLRGKMPSGAGPQVTQILLVTNLVLFTLMILHGTAVGFGLGSFINPPTQLLLAWGGQFWPAVLKYDQWWRCLTYAFVHGGIIHLAFNMMVLYQVGPLIESEVGRARFTILYTLTALTGTIAGYFWHPMTPVVGASGALFGLIGFAISWYHRMGGAGEALRNFMLRWALFAFVFGLLVGADNAAHLGGLVGGAVLGFLFPNTYRLKKQLEPLFNLLGAICGLALVTSLIMLGIWLITG